MSKFVLIIFLATVVNLIPTHSTNAQPQLKIRKNFSSLTNAEKESIKRGIAAMKSRPATDPTSWQFQANMHWMVGAPTSPLFNKCQHGTDYFLVWHRGFIFYFEKILRKASGDQNLTLPYWNWTDQPSLPIEFRFPSDSSNPLFSQGRILNDGSSINPQLVRFDLDRALAQISFWRFQSDIENSPHGSVHVAIGGLMARVPTAANDPIFWLHHGNVDRNWDRWLNLKNGRTNPTDPNFLNNSFQFADDNGQTVNVRVRDILTSAQLGYRYDDVPSQGESPEMAMAPQESKVVATSLNQTESPDNRKLGFDEKRVKLAFEDQGLESVQAASTPENAGREAIFVKIVGISFKDLPAFTYGVYLNLPDGETNEQRTLPHYVGSINFFGTDHDHGDAAPDAHAAQPRAHGHAKPRKDKVEGAEKPADDKDARHTFDAEFEITDVVATLRAAGSWNPESISIVLRPLAPIPPKELEEEKNKFYLESAKLAELSYDKIEIRIGEK